MEELQPLTDLHTRSRHQSVRGRAGASLNVESYQHQDYVKLNTPKLSTPTRRHFSCRILLRPFDRILTYAWALEIFSLVIAIIALAAIFITLAVHAGRPMPQWPKLISINSLIAIFTAILKAALMVPVAEGIGQLKWHWFQEPRPLIDLDRIDAASRGPFGSLVLIFKVYKHHLAFLGAIITVVALAVDPFSQQVVQYYECPQPVQGPVAAVPKTNNYTRSGAAVSSDSSGLDNTMFAALYLGLIQPPNATSSIPIQCPTGNCSFMEDRGATYSSLAMCGSCSDISGMIKRDKTRNSSETGMVAYSLPSGPEIGWPAGISLAGDLAWLSSTAYGSVDSTPDIDYVAGFDTLMYIEHGCTNATELDSKCDYEPFAVRCHIYPCMKTYKASISNYVLEEQLLNTTRLPMAYESPEVSSSFSTGFTLLSNSVLRDGTWVECSGVDEPTKTHPAAGPNQYTTKVQPPTKYYPEDCLWHFGWQTTQALAFAFYDLFDGPTVNSTLIPYTPATAHGAPWNMRLFANGTATLDSANAYITGLTDAMTAIIRQNGDTPSSGYAHGTAYSLQTCIRVKWAWLSLPSALILLAIAFLTATIIETREGELVFKSSALALLFHGLDSRSREQYGTMLDQASMKVAAEEVRTKLARPDLGWRFVVDK